MPCRTEIVVERGSLAVMRCDCGSLHVRVGHATIGFDRKGFVALASLLAEALPEIREDGAARARLPN